MTISDFTQGREGHCAMLCGITEDRPPVLSTCSQLPLATLIPVNFDGKIKYMLINWYGQSCFLIRGRDKEDVEAKSENISLLIDPFDKKVGLTPPRIKPEILLITHEHYDHNNRKLAGSETVTIEGPGEYEIRGIGIKGIHSWHDDKEGAERGPNTIYSIVFEGMHLLHLGDLGEKEISSGALKEIGGVDILFLPVGGVFTIDASRAVHILHQIQPRIVIPMHYRLPKLSIKLNSVDEFVKASGFKSVKEDKLNIKKKDLPTAEDTQLRLLAVGKQGPDK